MKDTVESLLRHRKIYFSQNGEDGLLEFILSKIPYKSKWCVEFGAGDGRHLSNTYLFISRHEYNGVLIEADPEKHKELCKNMKNHPSCICIKELVTPDGKNRLDNILETTPIPKRFDLLSIDVDGGDYYIWQSTKEYEPSVVVIEINMQDKPSVEHINKRGLPFDPNTTGTSISSMTSLAKNKGYALIANINCNAIYVKREYLTLFHEREITPEEVFLYDAYPVYRLTLRELKMLGTSRVVSRFLTLLYRKISFWRK